MTKKVIGDNASTQASAVAAIKAAAAQRSSDAAPTPQDAVSLIKAAAARQQGAAPQQQQGVPFDFTKCHLHIGMPCYGGNVSEPTMTSLLRFILMAQQVGLNWSLDTMVTRA